MTAKQVKHDELIAGRFYRVNYLNSGEYTVKAVNHKRVLVLSCDGKISLRPQSGTIRTAKSIIEISESMAYLRPETNEQAKELLASSLPPELW